MVNETAFTFLNLEAIITTSLVGLGLLVALYALIFQQIDQIVDKRIKKLKTIITQRDEAYKKIDEDRDNESYQENYNQLRADVKRFRDIQYHYGWGYIISGILFSTSLFFPFVDTYYPTFIGTNFEFFVNNAHLIMFVGLMNFVVIFFATIWDLKTFITQKIDEIEYQDNKKQEGKKKKGK